MAKQLNVSLNFNANTNQAKSQINDLQKSLYQLATRTNIDVKIDAGNIVKASEAARELSKHLNNAYNPQIDNLDLNKLNKSLKSAGTSVKELSSQLLLAGSGGEQAFVKLAQSIAAAERPVIKINARLKEFSTTLANTARWQISSSVLHGFMGAISTAYSYAQDLNESLNNIRIVTGYNIDQMAEFADEANRAAKALSTTTTNYTNASLIYYQQGLSQQEVIERTNVTTKMANVVGESVEEVSNQLTAVWNNFYDGSKSLEYYADVMTALGAATASSSDEISEGLNKFASVADTVGLSYEYAASALATVTATTRQSADVVGTAFKTLFARIQGLNLGETLDDGTTLNKYSAALQSVGIDIKDMNGEIKDMDTILNEMGAKWQTISKDQQIALAQTVAGVRQYTQLIALMDNWDYMQENLATANDASGTLNKQQEIYEESWKAASKRVKASMEAIYSQLLDDEFFIDITNGFASLIDSISAFIDSLGGVKTIIIGLGSIFLSSFADKIGPALKNIKDNFSVLFGSASAQADKLAGEMNSIINSELEKDKALKTANGQSAGFSDSSRTALENAQALNTAKAKMAVHEEKMSKEEKEQYQWQLQRLQAAQEEAQTIADQITKRKEEIKILSDAEKSFNEDAAVSDLEEQRGKEHQNLLDRRRAAQAGNPLEEGDTLESLNAQIIQHSQLTDSLIASKKAFGEAAYEAYAKEMEATNGVIDNSNKVITAYDLLGDQATEYWYVLNDLNEFTWSEPEQFEEQLEMFDNVKSTISQLVGDSFPELDQALNGMAIPTNIVELRDQIAEVQQTLMQASIPASDLEKILRKMGQGKNISALRNNYKQLTKEQKELLEKQQAINRALEQFNPKHQVSGLEAIAKAAGGLGAVSAGIQSIRAAFSAWSNEDLSFGEKAIATIGGITAALPLLKEGISSIKDSYAGFLNIVHKKRMIAAQEYIAVNNAEVAAMTKSDIAKKFGVSNDLAQVLSTRAKTLALKENIGAMTAEQLVQATGMTTDQAAIVISAIKAGRTREEALAEAGLTVVKTGGIAATIKSTIAKGAEALAGAKAAITKGAESAAVWLKTAADTAETGGLWAKVLAYLAVQAAAAPVLVVTLLIVAAIAALAAIITIVVKSIQGLINKYNEDAIAAERANQAAQELANAYNRVKQEYEDMISAMENYQSARDALSELTKGTEEYEEALQNANRQALELIDNYGEYLNPSDYKWEGDELIIDEDALSKAKAAKAQEEKQAYAAAQMAKVSAQEATNESNITNFKRSSRKEMGMGDVTNGIITAVAPAIGMAFQASSFIYDKSVDKVLKAYQDNSNLLSGNYAQFSANMAQIGIIDQQLIKALYDNRDSLEDLGQDIVNAEKAKEIAAENTARELMSGSGYENSSAGRMALEASGKIYSQIYDKAKEKYENKNIKNDSIINEYARQAGLDDLKGFKVTEKTKDGFTYEYIDENDQKQTATATKEMVAEVLAAADAAGQLGESLGALRNKISNLNNSEDVADHALAKFISNGNLESTTKEEFDAIKEKADSEGTNAALGLTGNIFKDNKIAREMGYKNAREYREAFEKSLEVEWTIPEGLGENIADKLTLGASKKINQTYEEMGETGGQAYLDALSQIEQSIDWDSLTPEEQAETWDRIANIDWSSWDAGEQAADIVEEMGGHLDTSAESWQKNVDAMRDATDALPDLEKLKETMAQVKDITSDMSLGSIISEEDYNTLVKYNEALSEYFTILSDGSAMFTGDILDFQQAIKETNQKNLKDAIQAYDDRLGEMQDQVEAAEKALGGSTKNLDSLRDTASDGTKFGFNKDKVEDQLAFLESQNYSAEQVAVWREKLGDGELEKETLNEIASAVNTTADSFDVLKQKVDEIDASLQGLMNEVALEAEDAAERMELLEEGLINEDAYNNAAMAAHNKEKWEGMDPEEVEVYSDYLQEAALASGMLSDELKDNAEAAEDVALYTKKMNNGIETLADNFEDWSEILKKSNPASEEYAEAIIGMKNAMSDLLGVSEEFISNSFIIENMDDIAKAAEGDADAIDRLAIAAAKDILVNIELEDEGVREELYALHDELAAEIPNIQVGATLDDGDFLRKAAQIVETAGMSVDEANAYFRSLGFEPNFETKEVEVTSKKPIVETYTQDAGTEYKDYTTIGPDGESHTQRVPFVKTRSYSKTVGYTEDTEIMTVPSLTTDGGEPNFTLTRTNAGAMNNFSSVNAGGSSADGSGSSSKPNKQSKSKIADRYKEVNDSLDDMADALDDAAKAADRLYGKSRIDYLKKQNGLIQEEIGLLKQKKAQALANLSKDASAIGEAASQLGVSISIGGDGNISNYTSALSSIENQINSMVAAANSRPSGATEAEQETIEDLKEKADNLKEAISQYDETKELIEDLDNELVDKMNAWQDNNYEILTYELELKLEINDQSLETIDYYLNKISDDFYRMAESAALLVSSSNGMTNTSQLEVYLQELGQYETHLRNLQSAYNAGEISQAAYAEGLKEIQSGIYDNLNSLVELDKAMMHYYGDTLSMAGEELAKFTDQMDHSSSVLDHYESIMSALGKETDYKAMGTILQGQAKTLRDQADVAKETFEFYTREAEGKYAKYQEALSAGNTAAAELYYQEYLAAQQAADGAHDVYLEKIRALAEKSKAILENSLASHAKDLEKALTGGSSFDLVNRQMERAASLQEEYLTTTNQIYETNKMIRTAQQEIDKISNVTAKNKIKNFVIETQQLQNQGKLSKYELDIQQAKYDLLLAEIALQDAQNTKSTVRLKRDMSGNFSYVYTADDQAVNEAEQRYEDAQNRLYNISLDGANNYTEKYQQTLQEFYDTMTEMSTLQFRSQFETEEDYEKAVKIMQEGYYEQLEGYSKLYNVAITNDSRASTEAWSKDFTKMMTKSEEWKEAVSGYVGNVKDAFNDWFIQVDTLSVEAGVDFDSLEGNVEDVTNKSTALRDAIIGPDGVIDALDEELQRVSDVTGQYASLRSSLELTMRSYELLATAISRAAMAQSNLNTVTTNYNSGTYGGGTYTPPTSNDFSNFNNVWAGMNNVGNNTNDTNQDDEDKEPKSGSGDPLSEDPPYERNDEVIVPKGNYGYLDPNNPTILNRGAAIEDLYVTIDETKKIGNVNWYRFYDSKHSKKNWWIIGQNLLPQTQSFDTGGYTGSWGSYGKLAMLHEKELVLNAQDTENFLTSMELLDNITRILDLASMSSQMSGLSSPNLNNMESETLQQEVHIEASFPNVQDQNEIAEAFKTLVNEASQYVNRKK